MSGLIEHAQRFEVVQLEAILNEELRCEVSDHGDPAWGHIHGGPGEFRAVLPCGNQAIICRPLRDALVDRGQCTCFRCIFHAVTAANFVEL